jgi:hypothetical protein
MARSAPRRTVPASGRDPAEEQAQKRGLAATVRPDDPDAVPAHDPGREVPDQRPVSEAPGDALGLDHEAATGRIGGCGELDPALRRDPPCPFRAQDLKPPQPTLIAPAPRGDAVVRPLGLGRDGLVQPAQLGFLLGEDLLGPGLECGEAPIEDADPTAIEPPDRAADRGEERPVVADQHEPARQLARSCSSRSMVGRSR